MPAFYKIAKERRLVMSSPSGVFTLADAVSHVDKLSKDPDFDPSFSQIADFTQVTRIELSSDDIRRLAQKGIFSAHSRRAFIAPMKRSSESAGCLRFCEDSKAKKGYVFFAPSNKRWSGCSPKARALNNRGKRVVLMATLDMAA